jgi:hypothetical protein
MTASPKTFDFDFDPLRLPPPYYEALGLIIACSAQTEDIVEQAIAGCAGLDNEYGKSITKHMAMPLRFSVLKSVAEIKIDDLDALDDLDDLIQAVDSALRKRNTYVHHSICFDKDRDIFLAVREDARTRYEVDLVPITVSEIKSDAMAIYNAGIALFEFLRRHNLLPALPPPGRARDHKSKAARKKRKRTN